MYCRTHDIFDCWFAHDPEPRTLTVAFSPSEARIVSAALAGFAARVRDADFDRGLSWSLTADVADALSERVS